MRKAVFSGVFYPDNSVELHQTISSFFSRFVPQIPFLYKPFAILVPHAGYRYSGQVAAAAFSSISKFSYKRIIILGLSHRFQFSGASIDQVDSYDTPFGAIPVDTAFVEMLQSESDVFSFVDQAHSNEHSIEVECPFIYFLFKDSIPIVPIIIGEISLESVNQVADCLIKHINQSETLVIVSSDFSHFYTHIQAQQMDSKAIEFIHSFNFKLLWENHLNGVVEMCGMLPMMVLGRILNRLGIDRSKSLLYSHSGVFSGDLDSVVGYHSALFG